jgi:hypothetical protein
LTRSSASARKETLYVKDTLRSDARQFATEAIAQNDNTVPDGLQNLRQKQKEKALEETSESFQTCLAKVASEVGR